MSRPTPIEEYLFDLRGYTIVPGALDADHVADINGWTEGLPALKAGQRYAGMEVHTYRGADGMNLQNVCEGGPMFERLIDHPAWIDLVRHYLGVHAPFIHEMFLNVRDKGGYIGIHGGGAIVDGRVKGGIIDGQWCVQYMTVILALRDVGPGDGATVIVPGSHKSALRHPRQKTSGGISEAFGEAVEGAVEVHLKAGDALIFNDSLLHGSSTRANEGERRTIVMRYLPDSYAHRHGYEPSPQLLARLSEQKRKIVQPREPRRTP